MPSVEIDGTNSTVKTNVLTSQSASAITVPTGKVLTVTDAAGLTVNGATPAATAATAAAQYAIGTQVAPGTSGNLLTSNGSAWASSAPAAGGGLILVATVTASTSATVDFLTSFTSTYDTYMITGSSIVSDTDADDLACRIAISGAAQSGSTDYRYAELGRSDSGQDDRQSNGAAYVRMNNSFGTATGENSNFVMWVHNPANTAIYKCASFVLSEWASPGDFRVTHGGFTYDTSTAAWTGLQFFRAAGGNIASGVFHLYGMVKT